MIHAIHAARPGDIISRLMARVPQFLDVSVPLAAGIPAYPGNPEFELQPVKRIAAGGSSNVSQLVMGTHTGTHVDAPKHFFRRWRRRRCAAARPAARPRARRGNHQARRHRHGRARRGGPARGSARPAQDLQLGAVERRGLSPGLHLSRRRGRTRTSSSRASRWSASTTSRSSSSRSRAPRRTGRCCRRRSIIIEGLNLSEAEAGMYEMYCLPLRIAGGDGAPARVILKR